MKTITSTLADRVYQIAVEEAAEQSIGVSSLCSGILSDYFLGDEGSPAVLQSPKNQPPPKKIGAAAVLFNPATDLAEFPLQSVRLAQQFIDAALSLPGVRAFKDKRGVGFDPNFVFIEYVMTQRTGIAVSLYGAPKQHANPTIITKGRGLSYSRAKIYSQSDLNAVLPHIRKAYELKFGKF